MSRDDRDDEAILAAIARALRPGGRLALTAFNAYFAVRYHTDAAFDADRGVAHERTEVRDETGAVAAAELWTGCYTPRELRLLARARGLVVERISSVEPGAYGDDPPTTERPELLAHRPPPHLSRRPQDLARLGLVGATIRDLAVGSARLSRCDDPRQMPTVAAGGAGRWVRRRGRWGRPWPPRRRPSWPSPTP